MAYPTYVMVTLENIGSTTCGKSTRMVFNGSATPPRYDMISGGDFQFASLTRKMEGEEVIWELRLYRMATPCQGNRYFRRSPAADDPTGDFCLLVNNALDCDGGKAVVVDDD